MADKAAADIKALNLRDRSEDSERRDEVSVLTTVGMRTTARTRPFSSSSVLRRTDGRATRDSARRPRASESLDSAGTSPASSPAHARVPTTARRAAPRRRRLTDRRPPRTTGVRSAAHRGRPERGGARRDDRPPGRVGRPDDLVRDEARRR
eukprot:30837-Pelagococcus_subviridis.AAC.19